MVTLELEQDLFYILTSLVMELSQHSLTAVHHVTFIFGPVITVMLE